jgi:nitrite reductase/ring-hydroxylating ferredoxin subunit
MEGYIKLCKTGDVPPGQVKGFFKEGKSVAVANINGKFYAFEDVCPHMSQKISNGNWENNMISCPGHGFKFDMTTGKPDTTANDPLKMYEVKVDGDEVHVKEIIVKSPWQRD